ncbi:hypothetical protein ACQPZQ_30535 [Pseudonocardia sp. CA-142604]|uniref:hypothetical protein n=1 Tax=Pseudonocardia sp. CA-142604 TaxID=3240024 RepID=UPI003D8F65BC
MRDTWEALPAELRHEFLARRTASTGWDLYRGQGADGLGWEPLRPLIVGEQSYRYLEAVAARLLHLAVQACRRRASTVGELYAVLRFPRDLPLMDPDRPLVATELTRYARPDFLIEQGRPQLLELNTSNRLAGTRQSSQLAERYARLCPSSGLSPPPSAVTARFAALARTPPTDHDRGRTRRALIPSYWATDHHHTIRHHTPGRSTLAAVARAGLEPVVAELADLRLDPTTRLLAGDVPIEVVLLEWGGHRIRYDRGALAALRAADRAATLGLFPRTEPYLISSKALLAWLHDDADAGLLTPPDEHLVHTHIPWTACLGLDKDPTTQPDLLRTAAIRRARLIVKPAFGRAGTGVLFGSRISDADWLPTLIRAARRSPLVLQRRVEPDFVAMPYRDQDSGRQVVAQVPFVLSPFLIDGAAASVWVRHLAPDTPNRDVVIDTRLGAHPNTVLLAP